jgi:hypothetical protein
MNDLEIDSLLVQAGYLYEPVSGRYRSEAGSDDESLAEDFATEDVADQLQIPVEDLLRWEEEQSAASG